MKMNLFAAILCSFTALIQIPFLPNSVSLMFLIVNSLLAVANFVLWYVLYEETNS